MEDKGIVRHRGKIEAAINNAQRLQELVAEEGSFAAWLWRHEPDPADLPPHAAPVSPVSQTLSKALKKRGWRFVGPTTVHAFLQAMGPVGILEVARTGVSGIARGDKVLSL